MENFVAKLPDFLKPWGDQMLLHYADFQGRTDRKTYWTVVLTNVIIGAIFGVLCLIPFINIIFGLLSMVWSLGFLVPGLAGTIRRLRDAGKHWAYIFMALIPLAGPIILIVFLAQE